MTSPTLSPHKLNCLQHNNPIQRICLHHSCKQRIMCLLCQTHLHGKQFLSILDKPTQSYKRFYDTISEQLDCYMLELKSNQDELLRQKQKDSLEMYFKQLKGRLELFLEDRMTQLTKMLQSEKYHTIQTLKTARVCRDFVHIDEQLFSICYRAYQGEKISTILQSNQTLKSQQAYKRVDMLHEEIKSTMQRFGFNMKIRIPDIRNRNELLGKKVQIKHEILVEGQYEDDYVDDKKMLDYKLLCQTQPFDSIISSSLKTSTDEIITLSYDKKLRIHKRNNRTIAQFDLLFEKQYGNILTKIQKIGQDMYAIGQSKELLIEKIVEENRKEWQCKNIMKLQGHKERIVDIAAYNTRIIGSVSHQGAKIWDLYKQRCQFTFTQPSNPTSLIFLPKINNLVIGYNNHLAKLYSIEKLKNIRKYQLPGLPLVFSQEKLNENAFYVGGFGSHLSVLDVRLNKLAFSYDFQGDAVEAIKEMVFAENRMLVGFRNGVVRIFDLQARRVRAEFKAESISTHLSKPNGIVGVYEQGQKEIITVGCNERRLKLWELSNADSYE